MYHIEGGVSEGAIVEISRGIGMFNVFEAAFLVIPSCIVFLAHVRRARSFCSAGALLHSITAAISSPLIRGTQRTSADPGQEPVLEAGHAAPVCMRKALHGVHDAKRLCWLAHYSGHVGSYERHLAPASAALHTTLGMWAAMNAIWLLVPAVRWDWSAVPYWADELPLPATLSRTYGLGVIACWPALMNLGLALLTADRINVWSRAVAGVDYEDAVRVLHQSFRHCCSLLVCGAWFINSGPYDVRQLAHMGGTEPAGYNRLGLHRYCAVGLALLAAQAAVQPDLQATQATLIVKSVGYWTRALARLAEDGLDPLHLVQVEGPYPDRSGDPGVAVPRSGDPGVAVPRAGDPGVAVHRSGDPGVDPGVAVHRSGDPGVDLDVAVHGSGDPGVAVHCSGDHGVDPGVAVHCSGDPGSGQNLAWLLLAGGVGIAPIAQLLHSILLRRGDAASCQPCTNIGSSEGSQLPANILNGWPTRTSGMDLEEGGLSEEQAPLLSFLPSHTYGLEVPNKLPLPTDGPFDELTSGPFSFSAASCRPPTSSPGTIHLLWLLRYQEAQALLGLYLPLLTAAVASGCYVSVCVMDTSASTAAMADKMQAAAAVGLEVPINKAAARGTYMELSSGLSAEELPLLAKALVNVAVPKDHDQACMASREWCPPLGGMWHMGVCMAAFLGLALGYFAGRALCSFSSMTAGEAGLQPLCGMEGGTGHQEQGHATNTQGITSASNLAPCYPPSARVHVVLSVILMRRGVCMMCDPADEKGPPEMPELPCCLLAACHMCARGAPPVLATLLATISSLLLAMAVKLVARVTLHTVPRAQHAGAGREHCEREPTPLHSTALGLPDTQTHVAACVADQKWPSFVQSCYRRPDVGKWLAGCISESSQAWGRGGSNGTCGHVHLACCGGEPLRDATCKAFVKHVLPFAPDADLHLFGV
eukprot:gene21274-28195_t